MTTIFTVHVEPSRDIDCINAVVADKEEELGPLVDIAADSKSTVLKFEYDIAPSNKAVIAEEVDGLAQIPPDATLVDEGVIFLRGKLVLCAATRAGG